MLPFTIQTCLIESTRVEMNIIISLHSFSRQGKDKNGANYAVIPSGSSGIGKNFIFNKHIVL